MFYLVKAIEIEISLWHRWQYSKIHSEMAEIMMCSYQISRMQSLETGNMFRIVSEEIQE